MITAAKKRMGLEDNLDRLRLGAMCERGYSAFDDGTGVARWDRGNLDDRLPR